MKFCLEYVGFGKTDIGKIADTRGEPLKRLLRVIVLWGNILHFQFLKRSDTDANNGMSIFQKGKGGETFLRRWGAEVS